MDKILSIIIPTYNMEKYLRKCLDSLIVSNENMNILEVLVINDGSKDSSSQIAHEYEAKYPHTFKVIDKENGNYGSCINRGLKEATGKYVKILDADDSFSMSGFEKLLEFLHGTDVDMVITDYVLVDETGKVNKRVSFPLEANREYLFDDICTNDGIIDITMHAVIHKVNNLRNLNYRQTEGISYTDAEWISLPMTIVRTVVYLQDVVYLYLVGREGQTMQGSVQDKSYEHNVISIVNRMEDLKNRNLVLSDNMRTFIYHAMNRIACYVYRATIMRGRYDIEKLKNFDNQIKRLNTELYLQTDSEYIDLKFYKFKYIHYFRSKGQSAPFVVRLMYVVLYKIFHK